MKVQPNKILPAELIQGIDWIEVLQLVAPLMVPAYKNVRYDDTDFVTDKAGMLKKSVCHFASVGSLIPSLRLSLDVPLISVTARSIAYVSSPHLIRSLSLSSMRASLAKRSESRLISVLSRKSSSTFELLSFCFISRMTKSLALLLVFPPLKARSPFTPTKVFARSGWVLLPLSAF